MRVLLLLKDGTYKELKIGSDFAGSKIVDIIEGK